MLFSGMENSKYDYPNHFIALGTKYLRTRIGKERKSLDSS